MYTITILSEDGLLAYDAGVATTRLVSCMRLLNKFRVALETKLRVKLINIISLEGVFIPIGFVTITVVIIDWHGGDSDCAFQYV